MKTELILKSDVLDIIFENRNKAYGAYYLRKFYGSRLMKSLAVMISGAIVLSAFTFMPNFKKHRENKEVETILGQILPQVKDPVKEPDKPKDPPPQQKLKTASVQFNQIKIVPDTKEVPPLEMITDSVRIDDVTKKGDPGAQFTVGSPADGGDEGKGKEPVTEPALNVNVPTAAPEIMPEFPGGMPALRKFLERNLTNPREMEENEAISVKVRFVVGFDGRLKSFETIEDGGEEFNKEVIRVLKKMPDWIPGKTRGQNVSVYYTIPVKFVPAN